MTKLIGELLIVFDHGRVDCQLFVDDRLQDMTEAELYCFKVELLLFRQSLLALPEPDFLADFKTFMRWRGWRWALSLGAAGRELSPTLRARIQALADQSEMPVARLLDDVD